MTQTNRIAIVDYGMGNLRSVEQALRHVVAGAEGAEVMLASTPMWLSQPTGSFSGAGRHARLHGRAGCA